MRNLWQELKRRREARAVERARTDLLRHAENEWRAEIERLRMESKKAMRFDALMADYEAERAENGRLREALRRIADYHPTITHQWAENVRAIARAALGEGKQ